MENGKTGKPKRWKTILKIITGNTVITLLFLVLISLLEGHRILLIVIYVCYIFGRVGFNYWMNWDTIKPAIEMYVDQLKYSREVKRWKKEKPKK